ncbi:MAG TPA: arginine--tRNA ligase [Candidatus Saccharimonadales bacterium]|nr:arginine--tRNA ligase [Candidatus Saccharimonadales bacterium]
MRQELEQTVVAACKDLFDARVTVSLTRPDEQFGDYATNVALQLGNQLDKKPREVAEAIESKLNHPAIQSVAVAGPGFLNITLTDEALVKVAEKQPANNLKGQEILVEFGDPNPFKSMHIGHLYSYIVGDAICSLLETAGATVRRLSYHGDVGLHVAKAIWGMQQGGYDSAAANDSKKNDVGLFYVQGAKAYESNENAKKQIDEINQLVYAKDASIQGLYTEGMERSFDNFKETLETLGIKNDKSYLESESAELGLETVRQNTGKVFTESDSAIVYEGEKVGLHTRVFITGKGLPTYETKDLGLTELKKRDYPNATRSIIITANEQAEYFKVMLAALKEIDPELADKTKHLTHGFVSLSSGKMSSRTGDVYNAATLIEDVHEAMEKLHPGSPKDHKIGAIRYAFVKHRLGGDLVYDVDESVSLEGNSGPYLQYAHARARSILNKSTGQAGTLEKLQPGERSLLRKIGEYPETVESAVAELLPSYIATYLYELAQTFNRFYENNRVIGDAREVVRLGLVQRYADTLKAGLELLNIPAPERM